MTPKSILALVDGSALSEATLDTAVSVAKTFGARLEALHVRADPATLVPIVGEGMSGAMVEQVMDAMAKSVEGRAQRARAAYDKAAAKASFPIVWRQETGPEPVVLAAAGRLVDLSVLARPDAAADGQMAASLDSALFDPGRPVLVAPPTSPASVGKRALAEALVAYLAKHNVKATVQSVQLHGKSVGQALLEQARQLNCDLLVMGAYGHSRLREMILGGATREVLAHSKISVLMAH